MKKINSIILISLMLVLFSFQFTSAIIYTNECNNQVDEGCNAECAGADYVFETSLWVLGDGCSNQNRITDSMFVNVDKGNYKVEARVHRGNPNQCQTNEVFYLEINNDNGFIAEDDSDPCAETIRWDNTGEFYFDQGSNEIIMHTASKCPPDVYANSIDIRKICLYKSDNLFPSIDEISANLESGFIPLDVKFNCDASNGDGDLSYSWNFGDGQTSNEQNPTHTYIQKGEYNAICTVKDEDGDKDSKSIIISAKKEPLEIAKINCFEDVIENHNQACVVYVKDSSNSPVANVDVDVYYSTGEYFGYCNTDELSGGCTVKDIQEKTGNFEVYATATKDNFMGDTDTHPRFSYNVLKEKYEIHDLKVYNDCEFTQENSDFLRGESIFVKFRVLKGGEPVDDIITKTTLESFPGGMIDLMEISNSDGWYFYKLDEIPLTHDFFGDSNVFSFAFNFTDGSGGQSEANLTIRNNVPVIKEIPDVKVYVKKKITIDLSDYGFDEEDPENITWEINSNSSLFSAVIDGNKLTIKGLKKGEDSLSLRLYDLDNEYSQSEINVVVKKKSSGGSGGGSGSDIIGYREVIELQPKQETGGISAFDIPPQEPEKIQEGAFISFLKSGYAAVLMLILLIILLILFLIVSFMKRE